MEKHFKLIKEDCTSTNYQIYGDDRVYGCDEVLSDSKFHGLTQLYERGDEKMDKGAWFFKEPL